MNDILWDIHKHLLWAVLLSFTPSPHPPHMTTILLVSKPPVFYDIGAKLYARCVCAIIGTTKLEHVGIEEISLL